MLTTLTTVLAALASLALTPPATQNAQPAAAEPAQLPPVMAEDADAPTDADADTWTIKRVGGDMDAAAEYANGVWRWKDVCKIDTPLPEGYPAPTPPGAIDLKRYPSVRRAEVRSSVQPDLGMNVGFWPLFNHIQRRDIAMTSPVEMDYKGMESRGTGENEGEAPTPPSEWAMAFLYRTADLGPTGTDGNVRILDSEPVTVLSIGMRGPYGLPLVQRGLAQLEAWLAENPGWERAGDVRAFYYNGPDMPRNRSWAEVQVVVREAARGEAVSGQKEGQ